MRIQADSDIENIEPIETTVHLRSGKVLKVGSDDGAVDVDGMFSLFDLDDNCVASFPINSIDVIIYDQENVQAMVSNDIAVLAYYLSKYWPDEVDGRCATEIAVNLLERLKVLDKNSDELANYLMRHWSDEMGGGPEHTGESAVEMAIRLLERLREEEPNDLR